MGSRWYRITFEIDAFTGDREVDRQDLGHRALLLLLDALFKININFLQKYPQTPLLYAAGIKYQFEVPGQEEWQDVPTTIQKGVGDCEDLACWRAAELVVRYGIPAKPLFTWRRLGGGGSLYHIRVWTPEGVEDPSLVLGMPGKAA